jgi:hypothetical protein
MTRSPSADQISNFDSLALDERVTHYRQQLGALFRENPWAVWTSKFWTYGSWARHDPELQKMLARTYALLDELFRLDTIPEAHQRRIEQLLRHDPGTLALDAGIELFDALDRVMIEIGDAHYICGEIEGELKWAKGSTTWLTWDVMNGSVPPAVNTYRSGKSVSAAELDAARNQLLSFRRTRSDDYQVHRARQKMRARNLRILAVLLLPLVLAFGWILAASRIGDLTTLGVWLIGVVGALGSLMSGTIKARDRLVRGSDLRAFRAGLLAQVLLGAASSLVAYLLLASEIVEIVGTDSLEGKAVVGFLAGFSEPYFLKTVGRVATMGDEAGEAVPRSEKAGSDAEESKSGA